MNIFMTNGHDNCIGSNDNPGHTKHLIIVPNCDKEYIIDIVAALSAHVFKVAQ